MTKKKIAVVGAGISGLTCAYNLQKAGHDVVVLEKENYVGGRMSTREKDGLPMDIGANHLADVYTHMKKYVAELGLTWKPMEFLNYRMVHKKHFDQIELEHIVPLLTDISNKTKRKLAWEGFWGTRKNTDFFDLSTATKYDTDNLEHYTRTKMTDEAYDFIVDPFVSTYQFHRGDEISKGMGYAMMRTHYKEKKEWDLQHIAGGMVALPQALANKMDVRLGQAVKQVKKMDSGIEVYTEDKKETFDLVVLASTANVTKEIYKDVTEGQKSILDKTKYAVTVGVGFKIPKDALGETTIVWVPYVKGGRISGYTNEAMKGDELIKDGKTLLLTWYHENFAKTIINKSDEEIFAITKKELVKVCPFVKEEMLENHDLQRWPQAMPKYYHGYLKEVKNFLENHQGENNVFFCGDYLNAPWTEGALRVGERVAESVLQSLKQ